MLLSLNQLNDNNIALGVYSALSFNLHQTIRIIEPILCYFKYECKLIKYQNVSQLDFYSILIFNGFTSF